MTKRYTIKVPCGDCLGVGERYYGKIKRKCDTCKGTGEVDRVVNEVTGEQER